MVLLARGENEDARATLEHAVAAARELKRSVGTLSGAPAARGGGAPVSAMLDRALAHLREGMRLAREARCITGRPLLKHRALLSKLAELALANGIEVEHTKRDRREAQASTAIASRSMPGHGRCASVPSERSRWQREGAETDAEPSTGKKKPKKPFELLQYLDRARGRRGLLRCGDSMPLWPDAEGDAGKRSFDVTLYRLRKLLGSEEAIKLEGTKLSLERGHVLDRLLRVRAARRGDWRRRTRLRRGSDSTLPLGRALVAVSRSLSGERRGVSLGERLSREAARQAACRSSSAPVIASNPSARSGDASSSTAGRCNSIRWQSQWTGG